MNPLDRPWNLLAESLHEHPGEVAVHDGTPRTYGELHRDAVALASGLARELAVGERVGLLVGNRYEYLVADLAILHAGLVKVPLNPALPTSDVVHVLRHSGARMLLVSRRLPVAGDVLLDALHAADLPLAVVDVDGAAYRGLLEAPRTPARPVGPHDSAVVYYTGGTTGLPKGVVHTQRSVATNLVAHVLEGEIRREEVLVLSTALSHSAGVFAAAALARGATVVVLDAFSPQRVCAALAEHDARWTLMVPTMLYRLLDHLTGTGAPAPRLDTLVYGSAPVTPHRLRQAIDLLGPVLIQLYGQTECPNWGTRLSKADHAAAAARPGLLGSAGRRSTMAAVRVVDDEGRPQPPGTVGEVCLAAPYVMAGYHRDPDATALTLVDGWVRTRDVGHLDGEGYLFLKDRLSDVIISGGYNVYSSDVETVIARLPGVRQVAVIGIPDDGWGEAVCALVVPDPAADLTEAGLRSACRAELGGYRAPKVVTFVDDIPVTPFGKADKKALRAPYWSGLPRPI